VIRAARVSRDYKTEHIFPLVEFGDFGLTTTLTRSCGVIDLTECFYVQMLKLDLVLVVAVVMSMMMSPSEAQLNTVDAAALFDLCDRPGTDLWPNCSDSANACINTNNWAGITCDFNQIAIVGMYEDDLPRSSMNLTHCQLTMDQRSMLSRPRGRIASIVDCEYDSAFSSVRLLSKCQPIELCSFFGATLHNLHSTPYLRSCQN